MKPARQPVLRFAAALLPFCVLASARAGDLPYPLLFVHGLIGDYRTFEGTLVQIQQVFALGDPYVYHACLNHDQDDETALLEADVAEIGWTAYGSDQLSQPPADTRLFALSLDDDVFQDIDGHGDHHHSNQAAIFKQGWAVGRAVTGVLEITGREKVVLVGHSMGGLAIREYLQRTVDDTPSGEHRWWVDPLDVEYGHDVARVVTIGTPHLGSNAGLDDPTRLAERDDWWEINSASESMRDLRYSYDSYPNCPDDPVGIYLFGGNEHCIDTQSWFSYWNTDINCDGDETGDITGIDTGTGDNPQIPLPENILYTWITSDTQEGECVWFPWCWFDDSPGDGAVLLDRQWLYTGSVPEPAGAADTLLIQTAHIDEGGDYRAIIRGLDEPDETEHAYAVDLDSCYTGGVTYQPGYAATDVDCYAFSAGETVLLALTIDGPDSGVTEYAISDGADSISWGNVESFPFMTEFVTPPGVCYLLLTCQADGDTWSNPYTFCLEGTALDPPTAIDDLSIQATENGVQLSWTEPACPSGGTLVPAEYRIYADADPYFEPQPELLQGTTQQASYLHEVDTEPAGSLFYRVVTDGYCLPGQRTQPVN